MCRASSQRGGHMRRWTLSVRLRPGRCRLQRELHVHRFRPQQLRCLRQRLRWTQSALLRGSLRPVHAVLPGRMVRRRWLWRGMRLSKRDVLRIQRLVLPWLLARQSVLSELLSLVTPGGECTPRRGSPSQLAKNNDQLSVWPKVTWTLSASASLLQYRRCARHTRRRGERRMIQLFNSP